MSNDNTQDNGTTIMVADHEAWHYSMTKHAVLPKITLEDAEQHVGFSTFDLVPTVAVTSEELRLFGLSAAVGAESPTDVVDAMADYVAERTSGTLGTTRRVSPVTGHHVPVGSVGFNTYTLTVPELFPIADAYIEASVLAFEARNVTGQATHFEAAEPRVVSAGLLGTVGAQAFIGIHIGDMVCDRGGAAYRIAVYVTAFDSADGSARLTFVASNIAPVCRNTVSAAISSADAETSMGVRHTSGMAAAMAGQLTAIADHNIGDACKLAVQCERLIGIGKPAKLDQLWNVAMSELKPAVWDESGPRPGAKAAALDSANGLHNRLRTLARQDPTNFDAVGENALGVVQTLTGFPRNHMEPVTRAVADAVDADGNLTDESIAAWRDGLATTFATTGRPDAVTGRYIRAADAVRDFALAN